MDNIKCLFGNLWKNNERLQNGEKISPNGLKIPDKNGIIFIDSKDKK